MSVSLILVVVMAVLYAAGIYLLLERSMTRVLVGFLLVGNATNLLILVVSGRAGAAPFYGEPGPLADPLPQAFVLTSIVITFGVSAFLMALIYRSWRLGQVYGAGVTWPPTDCNPVGGTTLEAAYSGTVIGGNATSALPPQCAMVTTLYTDQIGRRKRGRNYLPGLHEGMQSDGSIDSSTMTTFATQWNTLQNKYFSAGTDPTFRMGVWSYRTASGCERQKTPPYDHVKVETGHPELAFTPITRYVNRSVIYSQRKRTIGVGR